VTIASASERTAELAAALTVREREHLDELARLVEIPSVSASRRMSITLRGLPTRAPSKPRYGR
jgi:hypothetical protein